MMITHASGFVNIDGVEIIDDPAELLPLEVRMEVFRLMANTSKWIKRSKQGCVVRKCRQPKSS